MEAKNVIFKRRKLDAHNTIPMYDYLCPDCNSELHVDYGMPNFCSDCGCKLLWIRKDYQDLWNEVYSNPEGVIK